MPACERNGYNMITVLKNAKIYDGGILKSCEAAFDGTSLTMTGAMGGGNSVSKFENVAIVYIDKNTTTFRIGSMNEDAILGSIKFYNDSVVIFINTLNN